jgi:hypothetical protein
VPILVQYAHKCWTGAMRTSENSVKAKFAERAQDELLRMHLPETVWKIARGGFLISCVSCFKRARWDRFALYWLLARLQIEAYPDFPDFPDSLSTQSGE